MVIATKNGQSGRWIAVAQRRGQRDTTAPKRAKERPMRVDGSDSANAGVDEQACRPPAFQIIVLVSKHEL